MLCTPSAKLGQRGSVLLPGDLVEEGAGLEDEQVGEPVPDAERIHRDALADVGVFGPDVHPAASVDVIARARNRRSGLAHPLHVEGRRPAGAEQFEPEPVGFGVRDAGGREMDVSVVVVEKMGRSL